MSTPDPIEAVLAVRSPPNIAFELFVTRMGEWWDPRYTPDPATFTGIEVQPRVGGEVAMVHGERRFVWGKVLTWVPGRSYRQSFWLAHDAEHPSELDVQFRPSVSGSEVRFRHAGWTDANAAAREKYGDWQHLLGRYTDMAESRTGA